MLRSLYIKNYALIEEIKVDFNHGLSIITGETGAGKSILIDAISLLIGERASADLIRRGESKAIVEAEFEISMLPEISELLTVHGIDCESNDLLIRREINQKGAARGFVNDSPAGIPLMKELGAELLDLHGQHEHQSLLYPERHIDFLDDYAGLIARRKQFQELYERFYDLKKSYVDLLQHKTQIERETEYLAFQLHEIESVNPKHGEDDQIESELSILEHSEELRSLTDELHVILYESETSVQGCLASAKALLERLSKIDSRFSEQYKEVQSAAAIIDELSYSLSEYSNKIELQPYRLDELRNRQLALTRLKKKYGPTLNDVIAEYTKLQEQLSPEQNIEEKMRSIEKEMSVCRQHSVAIAQELSEARKKSAKEFEKKIIAELAELGIEHGKFKIEIIQEEIDGSDHSLIAFNGKSFAATKKGFDKVEYYISTNKGEALKPLARVASGGEVSRIMLALKSVLSADDKIPLMIFDEIDTGISGRIAQRVGKAMKNLSTRHQIIAITHLGQIAAFADTHFAIEKSTDGDVTTSSLRKLTKAEHEEEIARLISGSAITSRSIEAARSLLQEANSLVVV